MLADAIACPLTEKAIIKKAFEEKVELYEKENRINFSCDWIAYCTWGIQLQRSI